jgi:hypothetical protein
MGRIYNLEGNYIYEGGLLNYKKNGKGTEKTNDFTYKGNFFDNNKSGFGFITFLKSGDFFEGDFKDNRIFKGLYSWKESKNTYEGFFENNKMHGEGVYTYSSGSKSTYIGNYKNGKKHGFGIIKENNNIIYEGEFFEGNPHGQGFRFDKNGNKIKIEMDKGKRISIKNNESSGKRLSKTIGLSNLMKLNFLLFDLIFFYFF